MSERFKLNEISPNIFKYLAFVWGITANKDAETRMGVLTRHAEQILTLQRVAEVCQRMINSHQDVKKIARKEFWQVQARQLGNYTQNICWDEAHARDLYTRMSVSMYRFLWLGAVCDIWTFVYICLCVEWSVCVCEHIFQLSFVHVCVCLFVCSSYMFTYLSVCISFYIHIALPAYICMYIYAHMYPYTNFIYINTRIQTYT